MLLISDGWLAPCPKFGSPARRAPRIAVAVAAEELPLWRPVDVNEAPGEEALSSSDARDTCCDFGALGGIVLALIFLAAATPMFRCFLLL